MNEEAKSLKKKKINRGRFQKGERRARELGRLGGMASPTKFVEGDVRAKEAGRRGGKKKKKGGEENE